MAKKYKRSATATQARPSAAVESAAASTTAGRPVSMFARRGSAVEFEPDYTYVIHDLKRIGVISGVFVVILIALHFILG